MVTLRMIPATGIASQLPQSGTAEQMPHPDVVVTLEKDGSVLMDDHSVTLDELTQKLAAGDVAKTVVTIAGASSASIQQLMGVMDACRTAGITQIGLAAKSDP
jgi:biopolymer transport protein ExbD